MPDADGYDPKKPQKNGFDPLEEILDFKDNDGDGEVVQFMIINGIKTGVDVFNDIDDDGDGYVDEEDEISFKNWIDDDGDGLIDEGIDEEFDLNDANEDYDFDGGWYTVSWIDDDGDDEFDEDPIDDDGDGRFNEDILDGIDNDGDGLIDEDTGGVEDDNDGDTKIDEDPKKYYHPFSNYMEYQIGRDKNGDGMNEFNTTTFPNDWDSDGDKMADGWEIWFTDYIYNSSNILQYQDNDSLPRGWEELFNGSLILFPSDYLPLGLQNGDDALKYVGKFNPDSDDSNENGVPDGEENYDNDEWQDPHHPFPEEAQIEACNNSAEYRGHSDPTDSTSTPQVEYRAIAESDPGSSINEGTGVGNINDELPEYKSLVQDEDTIILELSDEAEAIIAFEASQDKTSEAIDIKAPKSDF
jgi:hypothetical protein